MNVQTGIKSPVSGKNDLDYVREIEERIIWRLQTEFKAHHDLVQQIVADNFENIYKMFQARATEQEGKGVQSDMEESGLTQA